MAVIIIVIVVVLVASNAGTNQSGPIKIGFIEALTGDTANFGVSMKGGLDLAIKEINAAGGIRGQQIQAIYEDGKCNGRDAATAAQKLISVDHAKYLIGMICAGEVLGVAPISEQNKVFMMVQGSSPDITHVGKYIVRTSPSDALSGQALAGFAIQKGFKTVAVIKENTDFSMGLDTSFESSYKQQGGVVLDSEMFNSGTTDFRSLLTKIKSLKPDMIFIDPQSGENAARIATQARDLGIASQFFGAFFTGPEYVNAGVAANGTYMVDMPAFDASSTVSTSFLSSFKSLTGIEPAYPYYAAATYDQMKLLAQAWNAVGYEDTDKVRDYIHSVSSYDGVIGSFHFDENGDVVGILHRIVQVRSGKIVPVN